MVPEQVNVEGLKIWDSQRRERIILSGFQTWETLLDVLAREWIPYFECDQCGRVDYCKYVQDSPYVAGKHLDIQCGVAQKALRSFTQYTFHHFAESDFSLRQNYLDAAFFFLKFTYAAELRIGNFLDDSSMSFWGKEAGLAVAQLVWLREELDGLARHLQEFPSFLARQTIILVEGSTEKAFLEAMRQSRLASILFVEVESYGGRGNRKPGRLQMLLDRYTKDGYTVYIQGDADGAGGDPFQALCKNTGLPKERTFWFRHDFETAIPPYLLFQVLRELGELCNEISIDDFQKALTECDRSTIHILSDIYDIDLDSLKVDLAYRLANLIAHEIWWLHEEFMNTELGKFLQFVQLAN